MSAFDKLQSYSSKRGLEEKSDVFDVKTPEGALFARIHKQGYKLYNIEHKDKAGNLISEEAYSLLSDSEKELCSEHIEYTELYYTLTTKGNMEINAIAGSGKTTSLVFRIIHDIVTGETVKVMDINGAPVRVVDGVWVCTFLRSGAQELHDALEYWQRKLGYTVTADQVTCSTIDAEFKRCLNAMGVATNIGDDGKLRSLLKKAIDSCVTESMSGHTLTKEDYEIIGSIVTYYRGRLDKKRYSHPACRDYGITPSILDLIVKQFASLRQAEGVMDFDEIMELLYKYLYVTPNKNVQDFVANRYKYIYSDEFQDTSQMQYAILKFYARGHLKMNIDGVEPTEESEKVLYTGEETKGKFIAIGDPSQCVTGDTMLRTSGFKPIAIKDCSDGVVLRCPSGVGEKGTTVTGDVIVGTMDGNLIEFELEDGRKSVTSEGHAYFKEVSCSISPVWGNRRLEVSPSFFDSYDCVILEEHGRKCDTDDTTFYMFEKFDGIVDCVYGLSHTSLSREGIEAFASARLKNLDCSSTRLARIVSFATEFINGCYKCITVMPQKACDIVIGEKILAFNKGEKTLGLFAIASKKYVSYTGKLYDVNTDSKMFTLENGIILHNCIYSFKGSDSSIFSINFGNDFSPTYCRLSYNYRCPANILYPIVPSIHKNADSASQSILAAKEGGDFGVFEFASYSKMLEFMLDNIGKDLLGNKSVTILCRTNFDGIIPALVLESAKRFNFSLSGGGMTLDSPLPKRLVSMYCLFMEKSTPAVKACLEMFCLQREKYAIKKLMDVLKMNNMSIWDMPLEDLEVELDSLAELVKNVRPIFMPDGTRHRELELQALEMIYGILYERYSADTVYCNNTRAYIDAILYVLKSDDYKSVYEFAEEMELLNDKLHARVKKQKCDVRIATVHEFKGKESDCVYIWNDIDGVFPSVKADDDDSIDEERRIHYIACTRAREKSYILTQRGKVGLFVREMDAHIQTPSISVSLSKKDA